MPYQQIHSDHRRPALADQLIMHQGLGEQLAYQLAAKGALLVLSSRNKEALEACPCTSAHKQRHPPAHPAAR